MRRFLVVAAFCMGLGACSVVGSDKPLFGAADAAGAPVLRPGVWAMPESDCKGFDPAAPATAWPDCANLIIVGPDTLSGNERQDDGSIKKRSLPYILAAGDPRVLQLATPPDRKPEQPAYLYVGVRPGKKDTEGRVIEGDVWLVLCEQPRSDHPFDKRPPHPLPGLTQRGDSVCVATAQGPVRAATAATEKWLADMDDLDDAVITAHWVRDGEN